MSVFAEDARLVFGNGQPLVGPDEIRTGITAFFDTIAGLRHSIATEWLKKRVPSLQRCAPAATNGANGHEDRANF